jgi:preprotein translocase subunit SecE
MNREQRRLQAIEERRQRKAEEQAKAGGKSAVQRAQARRPVKQGNIFQRLGRFLSEVRQEMKRVSWPTRNQMVAFTTVTIITTTALTLFTFGLDQGFKQAVLAILVLR